MSLRSGILICLFELLLTQSLSAAGEALFRFKEPAQRTYKLEPGLTLQSDTMESSEWITAQSTANPNVEIVFGSRVVLKSVLSAELREILTRYFATISRELGDNVYILQLPDALAAARLATELVKLDSVEVAYPVMRRERSAEGRYARLPNDPNFEAQVYLENRSSTGDRTGPDLNVRAAWPYSRGENVTVAIVDDGVQTHHPDLIEATAGQPHFDFNLSTNTNDPPAFYGSHGTGVAGLTAAHGDNQTGMAGVAPQAKLASWPILGGEDNVDDELMMDMFQYQLNEVAVQNHSWGPVVPPSFFGALPPLQLGPSFLELMGIENATQNGRDGKGVIIVRAAGNSRTEVITEDPFDPFSYVILHPGQGDVNDDSYANDPRVIAVGAITETGRATSYSSFGTAVLVSALSGDFDSGSPALFTTDLIGEDGANAFTSPTDYRFGFSGFSGTSATAPQISGLVALLLSANPELSYRDVQLILALSSRQVYPNDPEVEINGAGLKVSHNTGYGIPDAGQAVQLALRWQTRPPLVTRYFSNAETNAIPDSGFYLTATGNGVPPELARVNARPSLGLQNDFDAELIPLFDAGYATNQISTDLSGMGALIRRGPAGDFADERNFFRRKLERAAEAGPEFAVVFNNSGDNLIVMSETDFTPIPAMFIGQTNGESLLLQTQTNTTLRAAIRRDSLEYTFNVDDTLITEHVGLRVRTSHSRRADLRIVVISPQGTRSIMQRLNYDDNPGPVDWIYYSVHHFLESSAGEWKVMITDEDLGDITATGNVEFLELRVLGVEINDDDHDSLDDDWERNWFTDLSQAPDVDSDGDGYLNSYEQAADMNPAAIDIPFTADLSVWNDDRVRLSWPATNDKVYEVLASPGVGQEFSVIAEIEGTFPETEFFIPVSEFEDQIFQVREKAPNI